MNKKWVLIISILLVIVLALALVYFFRDGGHNMGKVIDAKVVKEIPEGFIPLKEAAKWEGLSDSERGLRYVAWESQISFLDADLCVGGVTIYQTSFNNSAFIVKYNNEYYVNEEKILELINIVNSKQRE